VEEYRNIGNECKRGLYTCDTFYISQVVDILSNGNVKGKIAIKLFKSFPVLRKKPYWGNHFWSRGYCVSSIGLDETKIRKYVKHQEEREKKEESEQQEFGLF
jgi:putative transposase